MWALIFLGIAAALAFAVVPLTALALIANVWLFSQFGTYPGSQLAAIGILVVFPFDILWFKARLENGKRKKMEAAAQERAAFELRVEQIKGGVSAQGAEIRDIEQSSESASTRTRDRRGFLKRANIAIPLVVLVLAIIGAVYQIVADRLTGQ